MRTSSRVVGSAAVLLLAAGCSGGHGGGGGGGGNPKPPVGFCSADGWCFENPIPQGETLDAVSVLPDGTAFAAGNDGEALRYADGVWSEMNVDVGNSLSAIRAFDATHVVAAGFDGVFWWDGTTWTKDALFPAYGGTGIWASSPTDVWISDESDNAYQWKGSTWTTETITPSIGTTAAISGTSDTDLWIAGADGIAHRTGPAAWVTTNLGTYLYFQSIADVSPSDVWAGSEDDGIWHFDGSHWSQFDSSPYYVTGMYPVDATHVYAAAEDPGLLMFDGASWNAIGGTGYGGLYDLTGVGMRNGSDGWAVGDHGKLVHVSGGGATEVSTGVGSGGRIAQISVVSASEIWGGDANSNDTYSYDGSKWSDHNMGIDSPAGIYAAGHDDVFAGSNYGGAIAHLDASGWTTQLSSGPDIDAMWGTGHSDVYAVGVGGYITHFDGSNWTQVAMGVTSNELYSVWGSGSGDVYAVGRQRTVLHGSGGSWTKIDSGITYSGDFHAVWAASASDVFIAGDGQILHGNAASGWTAETLPSPDSYVYWNAIWGTSLTDIWAATGGVLIHKDATGWTDKKLPTRLGISSIAGVGKDVWASGEQAAILHYKAP